MKVDVKLAGNSYSEVPAVLIPLKSGGKARFCEVSDTTAEAGDVLKGKTFYDADGNYTLGTNTGSTSAAETPMYNVTINQMPHQTITATFRPKATGSVSVSAKSADKSTKLAGEGTIGVSYEWQIKVTADEGWIGGRPTITGAVSNGAIYGDVVISVTEATEIPPDVHVPAGYTPVYLSQGKLYTDNSTSEALTLKNQIAAGSCLYVIDLTHDTTSLKGLFSPSGKNEAGVGCDEAVVDLSGINKNTITELGSLFLGNANLESADMSGFGEINTLYSLFAYCTSLKCVYFDTLSNIRAKEVNTYHTFSTCSNLEYLILDNTSVDFVVESADHDERGIPSQTKVLVPRASLDAYKANSHWSPAADRILALEDFDIVRKDGTVTVTPKAV